MNPFTNAQSQRCPSRPETMPGNREAAAASPAQDPSSPTATSPAPDRMEAQRRLSTSSDASSSGHNDSHKLDSTMDYIPTRMTKVSTPKPAANPLQFVKVGPCDLFKSAQETLKKVEEVKKLKREVRDEAEDWQSNLDNWKCSRRKRVEHIIDRVVEVKKFELEEHERNRRKAKTFNEMMEERTSRGRKMSLLVHKDDDSNDLSDLGIGTSSDKSSVSEDYGNDDSNSVEDGDVSVKIHFSDQNGDSEPSGKLKNHNGRRDEVSELEEYTYDRAIQGYVNFTETRVKSRNANQISRSESECVEETSEEMAACSFTQIESAAPVRKPRNDSKVEEDIAEIERLQSDNISSSDLQSPEKKVNVPKVNILKRKELFERSESSELNEHLKVAPRAAGDFLNSKSIRDRVSNLERQKSEEQSEKMKQVKQLSSEISVKDRLSRLERQQSSDSELRSCSNSNLPILGSSGDVVVSPPPSIKDRLSSLEQVASHDRTSKTVAEITPASIKNRLSELEAPKEPLKKVTPVKDPSFRDKLANFRSSELDLNCQEAQKSNSSFVDSSARNSNTTESEFYHKRTFHRSLDSLDVDSSSLLNNERYERVQSLEDLDSCGPNRNYPASASSNENLVLSSHSGDTDREDSGIHTADVSCSAPIPYSRSGKPGGAQSSASEELLSLTSAETDIDVSSFLDQALMEEDLKMEPVYSRVDPEQKHDGLDPKQLLQFIAKKDICRNNQPQDVAVLPLAFPLTSSMTAEPPKEKPPPPPIELSDEEDPKRNIMASNFNSNNNSTNLTRHGSTKRLIKDIRQKRSDFLGIDGGNEENYLDCELKVAPPPDMTSFLQEERRLEQELYRQMQPTLYPESDHGSNQGESRDSGVELDNHLNSHSLHMDYSPEGHGFEEHSHQNNDLFGNTSSTTEEDEIMKKEREIIEMLEKEEQWRYGTNTILSPSDHHQVGEKLAAKLRELEQEKLRLEWERAEESRKVAAEQAARQEDQRRIRAKEEQLRQQESIVGRLPAGVPFNCNPSEMNLDALREERQRLKQEQAELERQREYLSANQSWDSSSSAAHRSLQDVSAPHRAGSHNQLNVPNSSTSLNCRLSLPDLQQSDLTVQSMNINHHRPPPPIPLSKPLSIVDQERHGVNGFSRQGQLQLSSDSIPMVESHHHRHNAVGLPSVPVATSPTSSTGSQQMTRQTLHALSAAPRSRIIATDTWVQAKRKPESQRNSNRDHYQHWLIQEAEHRRITEQQQRNAVSRKSLPANLSQNQNPQSKPTSVQPNGQPSWQYQHSQHQHSMHQHQLPLHNHLQHSHIPVPTAAPTVPPPPRQEKPLPDAIIQTLTQRVQNRASMNENNRRHENSPARDSRPPNQTVSNNINNNLSNMNMSHSHTNGNYAANSQEKMLSVSGKKKCSHCNEELGRGAAMIIESLRLFYHMDCFKCCVCHVQLGDGLMGTDVRVRNHKLHCHNCYSSDDGVKFSCV
ncbi:uncharacterized protein LOC113204576 isoform X9 [Frankliniella occidentalis]|uniref:Uncharacterized protein LOC113204576 isoform X9 n=1 Tax=Frankliniella occidentalis TaxID=133901 RepID=A0A9C6TZJ0_FRAOC|nr:uncharacterized protein LOC113204576 isoform X9 [Frankliniella occidentalis]